MASDHLWPHPPLTMQETIDKLAGANNEYRDGNLRAFRSVREGMKRNGKHPEVMFFGEPRDLDELIDGLEKHQPMQADQPAIVEAK
jgi:hypothetical protein